MKRNRPFKQKAFEMKRLPDHKSPNYGIEKIFPIFRWIPCQICGYEFRREPMWHVSIQSIDGFARYSWSSNVLDVYEKVCLHCFPTIEDVIKYRLKRIEELNTRPKPTELFQVGGNTKICNSCLQLPAYCKCQISVLPSDILNGMTFKEVCEAYPEIAKKLGIK